MNEYTSKVDLIINRLWRVNNNTWTVGSLI